MKHGSTFLRMDSDRHLWIVLSDPEKNPDQVMLVNMTTWDERKEKICLLKPGDHPWITHETCINYGDAVLEPCFRPWNEESPRSARAGIDSALLHLDTQFGNFAIEGPSPAGGRPLSCPTFAS